MRRSLSSLMVAIALGFACAPPVIRNVPPPVPTDEPPAVTVPVTAIPDSTPAVAPAPTDPSVVDPPRPPREFRAAWVSPVWGSGMKDWPSRTGMTADEQRDELRGLLDHARDIGLNAIVLHVRTAGDALHPSTLVPWSPYLSGSSGRPPSPYYDPLAFAIEEAHARGLQLHAWFNPFRAMIPGLIDAAAPNHVTRAHPEWVKRYGTQTWIDPGQPAARRAVLDAILDVVRRYDIDGVHLDDYFYPYRERAPIRVRKGSRRRGPAGDLPFPDDDSWRRYGASRGFSDRASWRRANVDEFVQQLYTGVKREKPWVLVGISPFGIWRSGTPAGVTGLDAYGEIYADARKWLRAGWVDYFAPQLYWELAGEQARFRRLDAWWRSENPHERHLWPGLHTARVIGESRPWSQTEIPRQIEWLRQQRDDTDESQGHVHFRLASIRRGTALYDRLRSAYAEPALVPSSPWLGAKPPAQPASASISRGMLMVSAGDTTPVRWWLVRARDTSGRWRMELHPGSDVSIRTALADRRAYPIVTVAAVGRTELESPVQVVR